ncbi:MAG TPA: FAD/NAD(P)-binding protein [bacterium]|jgi:NAD(P)H-flavin reductase|nr:FAD/NAD(P)-binding protein [bacterium]HNT65469.1 FAD/NAD(P)-binding protein [bacterium]HOX87534.1 FAD/NAD(P)-binding protein [bacterium]HPG47282.1 FAD/NAD(P)-binding protein [bacterium]HPM99512.1 FAD/NAD(P)-binding protein [bacterium]
MSNPYRVIPATITEVIQESPMIRTLKLLPEEPIVFKTGQFVELSIPSVGEGPFTPSSSHYISDWMDITIMKTGFVTEAVHRAQVGDRVGLRGPYGSHYPLDKFAGKDVLILGGGCGLAPLRSLFTTMLHDVERYNSITFFAGAKSPKDCIYKDQVTGWRQFANVRFVRSVDVVPEGDQWNEDVGLVTKLLAKLDIDPKTNPAVVCGPPLMMKFGTWELLKIGFQESNIYLSMEKKMYCGFGQCRHCVMGKYYACKDGPVFTYDQIKNEEGIWE